MRNTTVTIRNPRPVAATDHLRAVSGLGLIARGAYAHVPPKRHAVNAIKQLEQDMGDAMVRVDIDTLNQIYADDFVTVASSGKIITKKDLLRDFESVRTAGTRVK